MSHSPATAKSTETSISDISIQRVTMKEGEEAIVVTCILRLKAGTTSPKLTAFALDQTGTTIQKKTSYGGRRYKPETYAKIGRQAATAASASPSATTIKNDGSLFYQFIFFDIADSFHQVSFTPAPTPKPKLPPSYQKQASKRLTATTPSPAVDLSNSSARLKLANGIKVRSFLMAELARLKAGPPILDNKNLKVPAPPITPDKRRAREALEPYGITPIWETLSMGLSLNEVIAALETIGGQGEDPPIVSVLACVGNICEYALTLPKADRSEYRLYLENSKLKSIVVGVDEKAITNRLHFLNSLKTVYGGRVWQGKAGGQAEFFAKHKEGQIETHGRFIHIVKY